VRTRVRIVCLEDCGDWQIQDEAGEPMVVGLFISRDAAWRWAKAERWEVVDHVRSSGQLVMKEQA
jgi:hypothetical protein